MPRKSNIGGTDVSAQSLVDVISEVPGFTPPNQVRSSEKTEAIIAATLELFREQSAGSIRMQDIAARAGCAVTAIYARFADRNVLYSAIHMLQLQECRSILDRKLTIDNLEGKGLLGLASVFVEVNEFYFSKNFNFVAAQLRSENDVAYRVTFDIMDDYARRFANVGAVLMSVGADTLMEPMKLAIHSVLAIYRDSILGARYFKRPGRKVLAQIFASIVEAQMAERDEGRFSPARPAISKASQR